MANRLIHTSSLYLKQHAENPVDWWPWGPEVFAEAQRRDCPILVSSGYAACHWCHVMARECFEDPYIARLMNTLFVCVKIDREEHPDADQIFMDAVTMINQRGGWPLHAFCLPDGRPFFGGTYFPAKDRGDGIIPWPQLLSRIADAFKRERQGLIENAESIEKNIAHLSAAPNPDRIPWDPQELLVASQQLIGFHDDTHGGFGSAPKFPPCQALTFLFRLRGSKAVETRPDLARRLDAVLRKTSQALAGGGLYDHLGGGFFRYSVDDAWETPHFEKMLYDNAQLLGVMAQAFLRFDNPLYETALRGTLRWLMETMQMDGLFAASLDAESAGVEGGFYLWDRKEIATLLGDETATFLRAHGSPQESDSSSEPLHLRRSADTEAEWQVHAAARGRLLEVRKKRPAPVQDPKGILSWNARLLSGLVAAANALTDPVLLRQARDFADKLWDTFVTPRGWLMRLAYPGEAARETGFLDDYAYFAEALLDLAGNIDLIEPGAHQVYLERAEGLLNQTLLRFQDTDEPGFFTTPHDHASPLPRKKEWYDGALPTGQASLLHGFLGLSAVTGLSRWQTAYEELRSNFAGLSGRIPNGIAHALAAITREAIGFAVLRGPQDAPQSALWPTRRSNPNRPIFLQLDLPPGSPWELMIANRSRTESPTPEPLLERL